MEKKKCIRYIIILIIALLIISIMLLKYIMQKRIHSKDDILTFSYTEAVADLQKLDVKTLLTKIADGDEFLVYIGRETCPHCQDFIKKLLLVKKEQIIYYLDSITTYDESPEELKNFRNTYSIQTVPQFFYFAERELKDQMIMDSEVPPSEILKFIKTYSQ